MAFRDFWEPYFGYKVSEFPNSIIVTRQKSLTLTALANTTPQEQMLDERLFSLIRQMQSELAGKITSMLLEINTTKLLHMLESLKAKVYIKEAIAVLQVYHAKQLYAATSLPSL
ncbi:unnamed protein product [Rotaria sordida]|uniref:PABC domain-containing protein n=2 Tax=Rotaria sordida TaxID=392033 RepID=A0A814SJ41_9BILA|nr:unnamed protein product [Rotaria sordida]